VEEAYNQEPGMVQHIFTMQYTVDRVRGGPDTKEWAASFTQEWPLGSQRHQFSYTVPCVVAERASRSSHGFGDVFLHYRYQVYSDEKSLTSLTPRLSLVLPTGDARKGFGNNTVGAQVNLPFSTTLGSKWFLHLNAGGTVLPGAGSSHDRDLWQYNGGASVIFAATRTFHLLTECVVYGNQAPIGLGTERNVSVIISPGFRKAINLKSGAQLVVGLAVPIGLTRDAPSVGVLFYLSFEHSFRRGK
jgi:hypothetical protein